MPGYTDLLQESPWVGHGSEVVRISLFNFTDWKNQVAIVTRDYSIGSEDTEVNWHHMNGFSPPGSDVSGLGRIGALPLKH